MRCSADWAPRVEHLPAQCPRCKSPYWNRPIVNHGASDKVRRRSVGVAKLVLGLEEISRKLKSWKSMILATDVAEELDRLAAAFKE